MFSALFIGTPATLTESHSQPGGPGMPDWAGVLEVWTWTYYSAEANTQTGRRNGRMHRNTHFETQE